MDVKTTFLRGYLKEKIYMTQPKNNIENGRVISFYKFKKSLYGLKHSPKMWYQKFDSFVLGLGFLRFKSNRYVLQTRWWSFPCYHSICRCYVIFCNSKDVIHDLKLQLSRQFDMKNLGTTKYILQVEIRRDRENRNNWLSHMPK